MEASRESEIDGTRDGAVNPADKGAASPSAARAQELFSEDKPDEPLDYENGHWETVADASGFYQDAVRRGDAAAVDRWFAASADDKRRRLLGFWNGTFNDGPLHVAAERGHTDVVRVLLKWADGCGVTGEAVEGVDGRGWTPLRCAVASGSEEVAAALLDGGADPNKRQPRADQREEDGRLPVTTALHESARRGDAPMVRFLLGHGASPDARDWRGDTALHATRWVAFDADSGPSGVVDALVEAGASLMAVNEFGQTPLAWACSPEARLTEQIMAGQIVGQTLRQALIRHHMTADAPSVEDARRCFEGLKASDPEVEWRVGIMLRDVCSKSGDGHRAGDVVLMRPCNNTDWDNLMVVRPKPSDGLLGAGTVAKASDRYDNMVIGVRGSAVVRIENLVPSPDGGAQI